MKEQLAKMLLSVRINMYMSGKGDDATDILAQLAATVVVVCTGAYISMPPAPWINQLRGALNTIQAMCLDGYRWDPIYANPLSNAIDIAIEHLREIPTRALLMGAEQGLLYEALIRAHQVTKETVAP